MKYLARAYGGYMIVAAIALFASIVLCVNDKHISGFDDTFENMLMTDPHGILIIAAGLIAALAGVLAIYDGFRSRRAHTSAFGFFMFFVAAVLIALRQLTSDQLDWSLTLVYLNVVVGALIIAAIIKDGYNLAPRAQAVDALLLIVVEVVFLLTYVDISNFTKLSTGYFMYAIIATLIVLGITSIASENRYLRFVVRKERIDLVTDYKAPKVLTARDAIIAADEKYVDECAAVAREALQKAAAEAQAAQAEAEVQEKAAAEAQAKQEAAEAQAAAEAAALAVLTAKIGDAVGVICDACFERELPLRRTNGSDGTHIAFDDYKIAVCVFEDPASIPEKEGWIILPFKLDEVTDGKKEAEVILDYLAETTPQDGQAQDPLNIGLTNEDLGVEPETVETPVRRALYNKGFRFRRNYGEYKIPVAFVSVKIAVFVTDDRVMDENDDKLLADGWTVVRFEGDKVTDGEKEAEYVGQMIKDALRKAKKAKAQKARAAAKKAAAKSKAD